MSKIIFISHDPLTDTIRRNNFLDRFLHDGIEVEYWCVRNIVKYAQHILLNNEIGTPYYREVISLAALDRMLAEQPYDVWIGVELWFNWDTAKIFSLLKSYQARLFKIDWYCNMPGISGRKKLLNDILSFKVQKLYKLLLRIFARKSFDIYARLLGIAPPALQFIPGKKVNVRKGRVVSLNHHDFDVFQSGAQSEAPNLVGGPYAVFLDIMLPYHPDFKRLGSGVLDAESYYMKLNAFFDQVERQYGVKLVVAAHPKSAYKQEFKGRDVIKGKTSELVAGSQFVLTHHSVSIFYAILNRKRLVLITMDEFKNAGARNFALQSIHLQIETYAELLHCSVINLDHLASWELHDADLSKYVQFERSYIRGGADKPNYLIIRDALGI